MPQPPQRIGRHLQGVNDGRIGAHRQCCFEKGNDGGIAPGATDEGVQCLPPAVGEVFRFGGQVPNGGQFFVDNGIAHPHGGMGVAGTQGKVFRQPFHHPQGNPLHGRQPQVGIRHGNIVLEGVHQFVTQHVVVFLVQPGKGQNHAIFQRFGDPAGAFAEGAKNGVGLLEVRLVGVKQNRFLFFKGMIHQSGKTVVPAFRHACPVHGGDLFLGVKMNVKVGRS